MTKQATIIVIGSERVKLYVCHRFLFWCFGNAEFRGCGISWVSSLIFFVQILDPSRKHAYLILTP